MTKELRSVSWPDLCPWLILFRTFRPAISMHLLALAFAGAILTPVGWRIGEAIFLSPSVLEDDASLAAQVNVWRRWPGARTPLPRNEGETTLQAMRTIAFPAIFGQMTTAAPASPAVDVPLSFVEPFRRMFNPTLTWGKLFYLIVGGVWTCAVWSIFGGAIMRTAAVRLGRDERVGIRQALEFSIKRFPSFFAAPMLPVVGIALMAIPLIAMGWLMKLNFGVLVAGILWLGVLGTGFLMAILAIGVVFGWPLMWATISTEGTDAFDALSRSYAYTFQRPLHYLFYGFVAAVLGTLGWLLAWGFSEAVVQLSYWGVSWGTGGDRLVEVRNLIGGPAPDGTSGVLWSGSQMIRFFIGLVRSVASGYGYSFFFCALSSVYLLLRLNADGEEMDDVYLETDDEAFGLPPLAKDKQGVPGTMETEEGAAAVTPSKPADKESHSEVATADDSQ